MIKNTRAAAILVLMLLMFVLPVTSIYAEGNLLQNPGFEEGEEGVPAGWTKDVWIAGDSSGLLSVQSEEVHSGSKAAVIENLEPNHLKWVQNITVTPDSYYKISGYIKVASTAGQGLGANIFPVGIGGGYPATTDTGGDWQYLEFIGQTGKEQTELGIGAALGGYSSLIQGKAYFDDLSVEQLDAAPEGASVISLDSGAAAQAGGSEAESPPHKVSPAKLLLISAVFSVFFALLYNRALRSNKLLLQQDIVYTRWLYIVFAGAFILRVWIGLTAKGYQNDMNTFIAWGQRLVDRGPGGFYEEGYFADYPPGYLYILYLLSAIRSLFGFTHGSGGETLLFKLPAIVSDLVLGGLIYRIGRKKLGSGVAMGLMLLFLFNPAVLMDSAAWGQADSFFMVFLLLSIMGAADKAFVRSAIWFAIAVLVKPQALIFTPVLLLAFYHHRAWKQLAVGALYGLGIFVLLAAPFFWNNGGLGGLIDLYKSTLSSYPYSTVNAFNLYALTDPMWSSMDLTWLGITYRVWGFIFILAAVAAAVYFSFKKDRKELSKSYFIGMVLIVIMFVLGTKMHERYIYPALILCLFSYIESRDRRFLTLFLGFTLTQYINVGYTLAHLNAGNNPPSDGIVLVTAIANLALLVYTLYTGYMVYVRKQTKLLAPPATDTEKRAADLALAEGIRPLEQNYKTKFKLLRKDWIWMLAITAVYAVLALINLGSTKAPETLWEPAASGESFYVDLGQSRQLERVNIFGGVGTGKFKLEFSATPDAWSSPLDVNEDVGNVFIWKSQPLNVAARYVKLTVTSPGFTLNEMAFYEQGGGKTPLPVTSVTPDAASAAKRGAPANLFDEQSIIPENSNFMNSTYFDEIYHARTAYEYFHGIIAYENTHPPLGKILIGVGMELFGVNPFGWRIVGTLFGVAMLPLIYIMALRLFKKSRYAALAAGLFALDFMHFTQTRISTIDVYGVFFIMLMFYFMQRYFTMNFYREPLRRTLVPLFWSGLFFGIGVASKWIVLYGGAGLAVMLALSLFERYKEHTAAGRVLAEGKLGDQELKAACLTADRSFWKNTVITLASCIVFFVVIPAVIYGLSFIPVLSVTAEGYTIKGLIQAQKNMYDYHSQLVATHPFASSWWEWPFMKRPVWFFSGGEGLPEGQVSSIVTIGNPLIWWTGIFAILGTVYLTVKRKDKSLYMLWIAFFSQYVPWMLVPRETFLYHYFAMVPFMILAIVYVMKLLDSKYPEAKYIRYAYVGLAALLFILFYPVLSGMQVSGDYVNTVLRWFPSWVF
ncbi:phospholipid carrier-dependent glycosyltransferase [Paenibacillus tianjinensis]|uniref:Polyprenol-phosphate-mannose--protein mannosyltransferase n=1 Tax=Paenibacillus tianjinensis TaxID=2810347 RepID=A0ABX7LBL3_9BACL|nr:phospholipid carrier-dependent glycosyltransferase [Paenibacillus tianjinensis]QSF45552.1 phospholipid carrier-dependent glycosyltransferase [Paenibacillus tianjinensis]